MHLCSIMHTCVCLMHRKARVYAQANVLCTQLRTQLCVAYTRLGGWQRLLAQASKHTAYACSCALAHGRIAVRWARARGTLLGMECKFLAHTVAHADQWVRVFGTPLATEWLLRYV